MNEMNETWSIFANKDENVSPDHFMKKMLQCHSDRWCLIFCSRWIISIILDREKPCLQWEIGDSRQKSRECLRVDWQIESHFTRSRCKDLNCSMIMSRQLSLFDHRCEASECTWILTQRFLIWGIEWAIAIPYNAYSISRREESRNHKLTACLLVCPQGQQNIEIKVFSKQYFHHFFRYSKLEL